MDPSESSSTQPKGTGQLGFSRPGSKKEDLSSHDHKAFSATTKEQLEQLIDSCWACALVFSDLENAHVVPQSEQNYHFLSSIGVLNFQISSIANGIRLCPTCHRFFDNRANPGWVFFPSDLDYFVQFELEDRRKRAGSDRQRRVPDTGSYLQHQQTTGEAGDDAEYPLYERHALTPEKWPLIAAQITGKKGWHGDPMAAIRSAWIAIGSVRDNAIPLECRQKLYYLLELYRTPIDQEVAVAFGPKLATLPPPGPDDDSDGNTKDKSTQEEGRAQGSKQEASPIKTLASKRRKR